MSTAFLNALKAKSPKPTIAPTPEAKPEYNTTLQIDPNCWNKLPDPLVITVNRVINKNKLEVFFSEKPNKELLERMKQNGWWFRPTDKGWEHSDTSEARSFCEAYFAACFNGEVDETQSTTSEESGSVISGVDSVTLTCNALETKETTPFELYKQQVNELTAHLKVEASDLALIAVNALHKATFSKDS